jgi:protein translocase SEC61 complex gamma subunit
MNLNPGKSLSTFIQNSKHILNISYKPTNTEFNRSAKVIILGILLIGAIGFLISVIISFITGAPI